METREISIPAFMVWPWVMWVRLASDSLASLVTILIGG